jgi:hypothetical protein
VFLWIREAGILLLQKSQEGCAELGFSKEYCAVFAQRKNPSWLAFAA